jgi:hypothetical protein
MSINYSIICDAHERAVIGPIIILRNRGGYTIDDIDQDDLAAFIAEHGPCGVSHLRFALDSLIRTNRGGRS